MSAQSQQAPMPTIYMPHGGGPWPWIPSQRDMYMELSTYLKNIPTLLPATPSAILVVSAHWEEPTPTLQTSPNPPMLYDYSGFPKETYSIKWPAPGAREHAAEVQSLLSDVGIPVGTDSERGFDHGTFVPLSLSYPDAQIPCFQLSLVRGLDPAEHIRIGRQLAPLRHRGVLIVGSGMSYHNMQGFIQTMRGGPAPVEESMAFDNWLAESMALEADRRETQLVEWAQAPYARACHPREEHLLPLHVVAGAGGDSPASMPYRESLLGIHVSALHFG